MPPNTNKHCSLEQSNERSSLLGCPSAASPHYSSSSSSSLDEEEGVNSRLTSSSSSSSSPPSRDSSLSPNIQLSFVSGRNRRDVPSHYYPNQGDNWKRGRSDSLKPNMKCRWRFLLLLASALSALMALYYWTPPQKPLPVVPPIIPHYYKPDDEHYQGPFSTLDPVQDLGLTAFERPAASRPSKLVTTTTTATTSTKPNQTIPATAAKTALPTNAWYQNLLLLQDDEKPSNIHRAYTIPYIVDATGPIPGLRMHPNHMDATTTVVQVGLVESFGLTLGATTTAGGGGGAAAGGGGGGGKKAAKNNNNQVKPFQYHVRRMTPLGITLEWKDFSMTSSIVRGMPYATMVYEKNWNDEHDQILPTVASETELASPPIIDGTTEMICSNSPSSKRMTAPMRVNREVQLTFKASDFTWIVFTSQPVLMRCQQDTKGATMLQVVDTALHDESAERQHSERNHPLVLRIALMEPCTHGNNPVYCHIDQLHPHGLYLGQGKFPELLRQHADAFPGPNTSFSYLVDEVTGSIQMKMDWNVQYMSDVSRYYHTDIDVDGDRASNETLVNYSDLITFALPHHFDMLPQNHPEFYDLINSDELYCASSLLGPTCLIQGSTWTLMDKVPRTDFRAPRSIEPQFLMAISKTLREDMKYALPDFYRRGSADTYFSGKMLARLARIALVAEEIMDTCRLEGLRGITLEEYAHYSRACQQIWIPSIDDLKETVEELKQSVQVWIDGTAETPFVYDYAWGGVVSCGCMFDGQKCTTNFPECPAFTDPGLNFGNAYYNDMHFHYGYHIFAAAVVAHFDPAWGREYFEHVLLLVRNIANPVEEDEYFTPWRHKDWFQGHSWASGIAGRYLNGRNQESSSEALAAYEGVFLYGNAMELAWLEVGETHQASIARAIKHTGQVMASSELRSARRYWHVNQDDDGGKIFPSTYKPRVIGIMWQTMAQFQTWFGNAPYLAYGIQLLPLTPISEERDGLRWARSMYTDFASSCESEEGCMKSGWRILQLAMEATVGHKQLAFDKSLQVDASVFEDPGGNGHSLSNTLWYIATRPRVNDPLPLKKHEDDLESSENGTEKKSKLNHCSRPSTCTDYVLDTIADIYTCRQRMEWLIKNGKSPLEACILIAAHEFPEQCGACNPLASGEEAPLPHCPPCPHDVCESEMNRCPQYEKTYVCTTGANRGGCSRVPWDGSDYTCSACCELTHCQKTSPAAMHTETTSVDEETCPLCTREFCQKTKVLCPLGGTAPFFCMKGPSRGGCSPHPWVLKDGDCEQCCTVTSELCG